MKQSPRPARPVAPGAIIRRELEARDWTQKDLARIMGRPAQAINEIVRGTKQITPETAIEMGEAFGTSPQFWTNLEAAYRLHLAERKTGGDSPIRKRSVLYTYAPVGELIKRGWITDKGSLDELVDEVLSFLRVKSLGDLPEVALNFRHSAERGPDAYAQLAWLRRVEHLAEQQNPAGYDRSRLAEAIPRILAHTEAPESVVEVPRLLLELGVHFVIVPHLPKTYLDAAMVRNRSNPVAALTLRYDRLDHFWFSLMHELAHLIADHQGTRLDDLDRKEVDPEEAAANESAQNWLLDPAAFAAFVAETRPFFSKHAIERFARSQQRHPSIVLGRLNREGLVNYRNLRPLHAKVRSRLAGWIDVPYPPGRDREKGNV